MYIYKIINKLNNKWYIGKHNGSNPNYMGSGKILKQAYKKYGINNFKKVILETCSTEEELNLKEIAWLNSTNALTDSNCYNLVEGGTGGDRSKFIPYTTIDYSNHKCDAARAWYNTLTEEQQRAEQERRHVKVCKGWYVSKIDDPSEVYVLNISKWCKENNIGSNYPTEMNTPGHPLFQKQTKGWRIRRSDMPLLPPYENRRNIGHPNIACKGRSWKLVDGKRVWYDK
jgi:hypothetical protein